MIKAYVLDLVVNYGYYGLFVSLVLGIVGLPIPDEILMTYCGYLVSRGTLSYAMTALTAIGGSIAGITISYWIGRHFGLPVIERHGRRFGITERRLQKVNGWYSRFGKIVLLIGYFIPGVRHVTAFAAGVSRMKFGSFALYAYSGGVIWALTFITLGKQLGAHWTQVAGLTHDLLFWALALAAGAGLAYWLLAMRRARTIK